MAKSPVPISEQITKAIEDAGGSISSEDLADALPEVAEANRNYHLKAMMTRGRIHMTGTRVRRTFHLGAAKADEPASAAPASNDEPVPDVLSAPAARLCRAAFVTPQHLRRLLAMALRAPEPISEADREALAAVAQEALAA
jgi:hypothetical protein